MSVAIEEQKKREARKPEEARLKKICEERGFHILPKKYENQTTEMWVSCLDCKHIFVLGQSNIETHYK